MRQILPRSAPVPSKNVVMRSTHASTTRKSYNTYQKGFLRFCNQKQINPDIYSMELIEGITDYFHSLTERQLGSGTVDSAKSSIVLLYKEQKSFVSPNPGQHGKCKNYVSGLIKHNKKEGIEEEIAAHPVTVHELSLIFNYLSNINPFLFKMYRCLLCTAYLGCFRISEVLALDWTSIGLKNNGKMEYLSVRLKWHKKASVSSSSKIYNMCDESDYPSLLIVSYFKEYKDMIDLLGIQYNSNTFVFPTVTVSSTGIPRVNWYKKMDQETLRKQINDICNIHSDLPLGITLHSLRRGGAFYRCAESKSARFNYRELMAWCRWEDVATCVKYLMSKSISDSIDTSNLFINKIMTSKESTINEINNLQQIESFDIQQFIATVKETVRQEMQRTYTNTLPRTLDYSNMDGVFLPNKKPPTEGEAYYSGHKKAYGLQMVSVCDFNTKFLMRMRILGIHQYSFWLI